MVEHSRLANASNGQKAFYSLKLSAWHQSGNVVDKPAHDSSILGLAGQDWNAEIAPVYYQDQDGNQIMVPGRRAVYRSDTGRPLGIVGTDYTIVQNSRMYEFFRSIAPRDTVIETAGTLDGGKRVWALARIPELMIAIGEDLTNGYLLFSTAHDGSASVRTLATSIRVVCQNTLNAAHKAGKGKGIRLKHTSGVEAGLLAAAQQYAAALENFQGLRDQLTALASRRSTTTSLEVISRAAFAVTAETLALEAKSESGRARTIRENRERQIRQIRNSATCNVRGTEGTLFADMQAVTEWVDHVFAKDDSTRAITGSGVEVKASALEAALALV
jgi:phage/plasmid-like protein (TIGR03299 family)